MGIVLGQTLVIQNYAMPYTVIYYRLSNFEYRVHNLKAMAPERM